MADSKDALGVAINSLYSRTQQQVSELESTQLSMLSTVVGGDSVEDFLVGNELTGDLGEEVVLNTLIKQVQNIYQQVSRGRATEVLQGQLIPFRAIKLANSGVKLGVKAENEIIVMQDGPILDTNQDPSIIPIAEVDDPFYGTLNFHASIMEDRGFIASYGEELIYGYNLLVEQNVCLLNGWFYVNGELLYNPVLPPRVSYYWIVSHTLNNFIPNLSNVGGEGTVWGVDIIGDPSGDTIVSLSTAQVTNWQIAGVPEEEWNFYQCPTPSHNVLEVGKRYGFVLDINLPIHDNSNNDKYMELYVAVGNFDIVAEVADGFNGKPNIGNEVEGFNSERMDWQNDGSEELNNLPSGENGYNYRLIVWWELLSDESVNLYFNGTVYNMDGGDARFQTGLPINSRTVGLSYKIKNAFVGSDITARVPDRLDQTAALSPHNAEPYGTVDPTQALQPGDRSIFPYPLTIEGGRLHIEGVWRYHKSPSAYVQQLEEILAVGHGDHYKEVR